MFNHVVYDVFNKGEDGDGEKDPQKLRGKSRFGDKLGDFSKKGLEFRWVQAKNTHTQEIKNEFRGKRGWWETSMFDFLIYLLASSKHGKKNLSSHSTFPIFKLIRIPILFCCKLEHSIDRSIAFG